MKNIDIRNKFLSLLTAGMIMATPVAANAENAKSESTSNSSTEFTLVQQEVQKTPLNMNEYINGIAEGMNYLNKFSMAKKYAHMQQDFQDFYYLVNRTYMDEATEEKLINQGVIHLTDPNNGKYDGFIAAINFIANINDYNQSTIRDMYRNNKIDTENLIDISKLCYDAHDAEILHSIFIHWANAYRDGRFPNENFIEAFKELTTLNSAEGEYNIHSASVGARWAAQVLIGGDVKQMLRDDMTEDFKRQELDKYFDKAKLNQAQWILRGDVSLDINCLKNELEEEVFYFGQLVYWCNETVNNDILKTFDKNDCNTKTK